MKRRNFLITSASAGLTGFLVPGLSRGATPCPPSTVSISGGTSANTACSNADAEADWLARSTAPGVVWAHDFRNDAEVNNFRWDGGIGDDPNGVQTSNIFRQTSDGIAGTNGKCMEIFTAAGTQAPGIWWRPLSPMTGAGNGRGVNDPGANGAITPQTFTPNPNYGGSNINSWGSRGLYGHSSYHGEGGFDGTEFYVQMRTKISASRYHASNFSNYGRGKMAYLSHTYRTLTSQEIVVENRHDKDWKAYRSGSPNIEPSLQYGSDIAPQIWKWAPDEWITQMMYVRPGIAPSNTTIFRMWVARAGQTSYTKIWDTSVMRLDAYDWDKGYNALALTSYMNGDKWPVAAYMRHTQIILSKQLIPCPQA